MRWTPCALASGTRTAMPAITAAATTPRPATKAPWCAIGDGRGAGATGYEGEKPGDEGDRYLEFWNHVFTELRQERTAATSLARKNINTGMAWNASPASCRV